MTVWDAVDNRRSVRAFLPKPIDMRRLQAVLTHAARAPSGGNLQPWQIHVLTGSALTAFKAIMQARLVDRQPREAMDYDIYPPSLSSPYRDRSFAAGEALYAALGIAREDKAGRHAQFARNFRFFDAPVALFCMTDRSMGSPQWSDLGMYLQTLMLLLVEEGWASCAQECWAIYPRTVADFLGTPPEQMLFCGMAIGYADPDAPANQSRTERADPSEFIHLHEAG